MEVGCESPRGRLRGGVGGVYDGDPHCELHGHVPPEVNTASTSSGPEGKSVDSQPIPWVVKPNGRSANCRTRVSSSSPDTLQVPLTGCTNRAASRTICCYRRKAAWKVWSPVLSEFERRRPYATDHPCCRHRLSTGDVMCKKKNHTNHRPHPKL